MSGRRAGRHRISDDEREGRHRDPQADRHEGRHRAVGFQSAAVQRAAIPPLLTASGAVAAAAMTALVLSGPGGSLGQLFADRSEEPRPSATSSTSRAGAPSDADIAGVLAGWAPGNGGMGNSWGVNLWDVLFPQNAGSPSTVLATPYDGVPGGALLWAGTGAGGAWTGATSVAAAQPISWSTEASPAPAALGSPGTGPQPWTAPAGTGPSSGPEPSGTTAPRPTDGDAPAGPVVKAAAPVTTVLPPVTGPVARAAAPVEPAAAPVVKAVEPAAGPVVKAVEPAAGPVVKAVEPAAAPVVKAVEPAAAPVVKAVEPAAEAVGPVVTAVAPVAPVAEAAPGPADIPSGEIERTVQIP